MNDRPHPSPLSPDGRGRTVRSLRGTPSGGGGLTVTRQRMNCDCCSLSRRPGEGQSEGIFP